MKTNNPGEAEIIREFRERQAETFTRSRLWIAMVVIGFVGVFVLNNRVDDVVVSFFFASAFIGIVALAFIVNRYYRCPACEEMVVGSDGVELFPRECPKCGARLSK